MYIKAC